MKIKHKTVSFLRPNMSKIEANAPKFSEQVFKKDSVRDCQGPKDHYGP